MDNDRWPHCHVCNSEFFPFCARGDCPGSKALETPAAAPSAPAPAEVPMPEPDVYWSSYRHGAEPVEIRSHSTPQLLAYAAAREAAAVERVRGVLRELVEANDALSGYRPPHDDELDRVARAWAAARAELGEKP